MNKKSLSHIRHKLSGCGCSNVICFWEKVLDLITVVKLWVKSHLLSLNYGNGILILRALNPREIKVIFSVNSADGKKWLKEMSCFRKD